MFPLVIIRWRGSSRFVSLARALGCSRALSLLKRLVCGDPAPGDWMVKHGSSLRFKTA